MSGFRFIHAADLHLDSPFAGLSGVPEQVRQALRESTFTALHRLTELAIRERADFVLIAGDVYESADRSLRAQVRFHKAMQRLAENGISAFVVHGNHDPLDGTQARLSWPDSVHFFAPGQVERVEVNLPGKGYVADIYGVSYPTSAVRDNYALSFRRLGGAPYCIGLLHANVDHASEHGDYAPCTLPELIGRGMDYWALGHIHSRRVLHENPYVVYPGNIQGRSIRELGPKGCYLAEVDEAGQTRLSFHPLDAVRWQQSRVSIAGLWTEQELKDRLERCLEEARLSGEGRPSVLRIELLGRGPLHSRLQGGFVRELAEELRLGEQERLELAAAGMEEYGGISRLEAEGELREERPDFVWLEKLVVRTGREANREELSASPGFLGDVLRLAKDMAGDREALGSFISDCLAPLLEHPKAGSLLRKAGLAAEGRPDEAFARDTLEQAVEWLLDRLLEEEEGRR